MASINKNSNNLPTTFKVRDVGKLFKTILLLAVLGTITYYVDRPVIQHVLKGTFDWQRSFKGDNLIGTIIVTTFTLLSSITLLRLRALWSGMVIDTEDMTLTFPGGSISANDFIDVFKPSFLFQYFLRRTIHLDDIRELSQQSNLSLMAKTVFIGTQLYLMVHLVQLRCGLTMKVNATRFIQPYVN